MADIGAGDAADKVGGDARRAGAIVRESGVGAKNLAIGAGRQSACAIELWRTLEGGTDLVRHGGRNRRRSNALPTKLFLQASGNHDALGGDAVDTGIECGGGVAAGLQASFDGESALGAVERGA